jgi:hypothetical protein
MIVLLLLVVVSAQVVPSSPSSNPNCVKIDEKVSEMFLGCVSNTLQWRIDCTQPIWLPTESTWIVKIESLVITFSRCPHPTLSAVLKFQLDVPDIIKENVNVTVPAGIQTATLTKSINGTDLEVLAWPIFGIITVPPNALFSDPRRVGVALVIKRPTVVGATKVNFDVAARLCALQTECSEFELADNLTFGFDDVCCIPRSLLCDNEVAQCYPTAAPTPDPNNPGAGPGNSNNPGASNNKPSFAHRLSATFSLTIATVFMASLLLL